VTKLSIPVTVGKRERLLKSKDTEIEFDEKMAILAISRLYIKETPKDIDDEYSPMEQSRMEYNITVKKSAITDVSWYWSKDYEIYVMDISINAECIAQIFMESRDKAKEAHKILCEWCFGS
jgi:hypothetical protein